MIQPRNVLIQRIIMTISLLVLIGFTVPVMALPPSIDADKLLLSAADKLNNGNYTAAEQDLKKITSLNVKLPVDYYYQYGRYLAATRQAVEAKKNLEIYLEKAGKKGEFYSAALEVYSEVEANEKRWARYKNNNDGTVTDIQTGLMWASEDNGLSINWPSAQAYCQNYSGGGYTDWRMPSQDELAGLFDKKESNHITPLIKRTSCCHWGSETRGSKAAVFAFSDGSRFWDIQSLPHSLRALPVRSGK